MLGFENNQTFLLPRRSVEAPSADKLVRAKGGGGGLGGFGGADDGEREQEKGSLFFSFPSSPTRILYLHEDRLFYTICTLSVANQLPEFSTQLEV